MRARMNEQIDNQFARSKELSRQILDSSWMKRFTKGISQPSRCSVSAMSSICLDKSSATTSSKSAVECSAEWEMGSRIINFASWSCWGCITTLIPIQIMLGLHFLFRLRGLFWLRFVNQAERDANVKETRADHHHYLLSY